MADIWDLEDTVNQDKEPACSRYYTKPGPYFKQVFHNNVYEVLQLVQNPVVSSSQSAKDGNASQTSSHRR